MKKRQEGRRKAASLVTRGWALALWAPALLAAPGAAEAQLHQGIPEGGRGWAVQVLGGAANDDGTRLEGRLSKRLPHHLFLLVAVGQTRFHGADTDREDTWLGFSWNAAPLLGDALPDLLPQRLTIFPGVEVRTSTMDDLEVSATHLGVGLRWRMLPEGGPRSISTFLTPQAVWRMATVESQTDTEWLGGLTGGISLTVGRLFVGVELERLWTSTTEDKAVIGLGICL